MADYFEKDNAEGGVNGHRINFVSRDHAYDDAYSGWLSDLWRLLDCAHLIHDRPRRLRFRFEATR